MWTAKLPATLTLILGAAFNGWLVWELHPLTQALVGEHFPTDQYDPDYLPRVLIPYLVDAASLIYFGALGIFRVRVAHQVVVLFLGMRIPILITEGFAWTLPFPLMNRIEENVQAREVDVGQKIYLSRDNVDVTADVSVVIRVTNAFRRQNLVESIDETARNLAEEATRRYILARRAQSEEVFRPTTELTPEQIQAVQESAAEFRTEIETNGRNYVTAQVHEFMSQYGIECVRTIIENVRLPQAIEQAGAERLRETLESIGDTVDWSNSAELVKALFTSLGEVGINVAEFPPETRAQMAEAAWDRVLAKKRQATRLSIGVQGGQNPLLDALSVLAANAQPRPQ